MAYGVLGLWAFTNLEIAYALLRVDERRRTYLVASVEQRAAHRRADGDARGRLRRRRARLRPRQLRGLDGRARRAVGLRAAPPRRARPARARTRPAAALRRADRAGRRRRLRAERRRPRVAAARRLAPPPRASTRWPVKLATLVIVAVRGFQAAWPPLAYSIVDEDEARHLYALRHDARTWSSPGSSVGGLDAARALGRAAADRAPFFAAHKALPWVALGWALYGLFLVFVTIAGRAKVTTRTLPGRASVGLAVNVVVLVAARRRRSGSPAPASRCARSYVAMLVVLLRCSRAGSSACRSTGGASPAHARRSAASRSAGELLLPTDRRRRASSAGSRLGGDPARARGRRASCGPTSCARVLAAARRARSEPGAAAVVVARRLAQPLAPSGAASRGRGSQ